MAGKKLHSLDVSSLMTKLQVEKRDMSGKEKGDAGEELALAVVRNYRKKYGASNDLIFHSFSYLCNEGVPGNVKLDTSSKKFYEVTAGTFYDEIDILYVSDFRIFVLEIKARSGTWRLKDNWTFRGKSPEEKCPLAQTEKHCRQLYSHIWQEIPNGDPNYIMGCTVFVDKCSIVDERKRSELFGIDVVVLNTLLNWMTAKDKPLLYKLNKSALNDKLTAILKGDDYGIY